MKKALFVCALSLLLALACFLPICATQAAPTEGAVIDLLDLLSPTEEKSIFPKTPLHGVKFYLITMQTAYPDDRPTDHEICITCGIENTYDIEPAVVLVVRKAGAGDAFYYDMYTYGDAYDIFSNQEIDRVLDADAVYNNLKAGNVNDGAAAFFSLCAAEIDEHYGRLAAKERRKPLTVVLIAVGVGTLTAGGSILAVVLSYRKKRHGESYPLDRYARLNLTHREDRFVGSFVTRVRVRTNSSSHGGSRGGGGGFRGGR